MGLTQDSLDLGKRSGITVYTNFFFLWVPRILSRF